MLQETLTFIATAAVVLAISGIGLSGQVKAATTETARRRMLAPRSAHRRDISALEIGGVLGIVLVGALVMVAAETYFSGQPSREMLAVIFQE